MAPARLPVKKTTSPRRQALRKQRWIVGLVGEVGLHDRKPRVDKGVDGAVQDFAGHAEGALDAIVRRGPLANLVCTGACSATLFGAWLEVAAPMAPARLPVKKTTSPRR